MEILLLSAALLAACIAAERLYAQLRAARAEITLLRALLADATDEGGDQ